MLKYVANNIKVVYNRVANPDCNFFKNLLENLNNNDITITKLEDL